MQSAFGEDRGRARQLIGLAVLSLLIAGILSLLLVVGRTPGIDKLITDPLMFRRALVVHVVLALVVWFHAFTAGLHALIPGPKSTSWARSGPWFSAMGVCAILAAPFFPGARPILANYIPVVDHPSFVGGLALFGFGILLSLLDLRALPFTEPCPVVHGRTLDGAQKVIPMPARRLRPVLSRSAVIGLRAAGIILVLALVTFVHTWARTPRFEDATAYYEVLFWGGGHLLQFASVAAMVAVWLALLERALGRELLSAPRATFLFGLLVAPAAFGALLPIYGTSSVVYRVGFTDLMRWGIFPSVTWVLLHCVAAIFTQDRVRALCRDGRVIAFFVSAALTVAGFILGALIRGSTTMVPAHYHASIGAVSVAFMGVTYVLLEPLGLRAFAGRRRALARWQPLVFGAGQLVFAIGFGMAGASRKVYGAEQIRRTLSESIGLGVMALGGLFAVIGGLLFLGLVVSAWSARAERAAPVVTSTPTLRGTAWHPQPASTPSRS